jgi:hypothetical protein
MSRLRRESVTAAVSGADSLKVHLCELVAKTHKVGVHSLETALSQPFELNVLTIAISSP